MQQGYNAYGEPIAEATRPMTSAEASVEKADKKGVKYDAPLNKSAQKMLFDDIFRKHVDAVKSKTGEEVKFSDFVIQNEDGTTSFDKTAITSTFSPELYEELTSKAQIMEEGIKENNFYPAESLNYTNREYEARSTKAQDEKTKAQKEAIAKEYEVPVEDIDALVNTPANEKAVSKIIELQEADPTEYSKVMEIARDLNPALFDAVATEHKKRGTVAPKDSDEYLKSLGMPPSESTGYTPEDEVF
jgi:hypothetical protein